MNQLLLVEDEPLERQALKMELETGDYDISEIYEASNGQEALDLFEEKHPDILIVDINIPVLSGLDFIERIVNSEAESKILITTTYDRSRYVRTAISLGVTDYLLKPIDYAELKNVSFCWKKNADRSENSSNCIPIPSIMFWRIFCRRS